MLSRRGKRKRIDMKIIYRYITSEFLKILLYSLVTFIAIYLIVDFFERFDMFIKHKAGAATVIKYFLFKIPFIIYQTIPVAVLLSTLLTMGILSKNNEITAMKSSGISIYKVSMPLIMITLAITLFTFVLGEYITPYTNMGTARIKSRLKKKKPRSFMKQSKIWYTGRNIIYNIDHFDGKTNELKGISIFRLDDDFTLVQRIDAKSAYYRDGAWVLRDVTTREFSYIDGDMGVKSLTKTPELKIDLPETPDTFKAVRKKAQEMNFSELRRFIAKLRAKGYSATEYEVDLQAKLSIPFISIVMTIIGIPFALRRGRAGSIALGVGLSIVIGFCYWIMLAFALSLGHAGVLPPPVAAWVSLFIFMLIGAYMFSSIRQ